jgi:NAD(P)-dependent dehydrogenase (short-subunit alcohol dehydrogenase family)
MTLVALVTGANRGIGREAARRLAGHGMTVLLGSRDGGRGAAAVNELQASGLDVASVVLDVTDEASVLTAAKQVGDAFGRLDVLVNNAGVFIGATAVETTAAHLRETFEVNVFGAVTTIRTFLPLLRRSAAPRIINVSSTVASLEASASGAVIPGDASRRLAYASSKAALNMLTVQYATAFAADVELRGIKINSVTPGYTATRMNDFRGTRSVGEAADVIVRLATLAADGPTGGFLGDDGPVAW